MGARMVWAMSNFIVFICMAATTIISLWSINEHLTGIQHVVGANKAVRVGALVIFSLLGFPLAVSINLHPVITGKSFLANVLELILFLPADYIQCPILCNC